MHSKIIYTIISFLLISTVLFSQENSLFKKKQFVQNLDTLNYRVLFPKNFSKEKKYPVVLFLHGSGERGNDNELQLTHGSSLFLQKNTRENFPAIVLFPQCSLDDYWSDVEIDRSTKPITFKFQNKAEPTKSLGLVIQLMDSLLQKSFVKKDQVYVMGLSMGGMGTFEILARRPDLFTAAVPICGGGNPSTAKLYAKNTKLWIFHGAKDDVVSPQFSIEMVKGIMNAGGSPNFTLYENANHNSWDAAFAEPNLLPWLFSKKRIKN
tara:strand:+ start:65690 stop:66484 length:795 start_codon:yes stop_codon:yes gene_type:complete